MAEVLRLLRLSLILRVAIAVVAVIAIGAFAGSIPPIAPLTVIGSLALVIIISIALAKGKADANTANRLIAAAIVVQAIEIAVQGLIFRGGPGRAPRDFGPEFQTVDFVASTLLLRGALGGPLFMAIPAMLGAWIGGRRSVIGWTALAVLANFAGDVIVLAPNWAALRFIVPSTLSLVGVVGILAYFVGSLADKMRGEQQQLEAANRQLTEQAHVREQLATSRERVRLARDLHDTLAHTLAGLVVQMNAIATLLASEPDAAKNELKKAQAAAKSGLEETRAAIGDLRANVVEDLGLSGALRRQAGVLQQRGTARVTFEQRGAEPPLTKDQAETIFRIAQEAMNNVERHAGAKQVVVTLATDDGRGTAHATPSSSNGKQVVLSVCDDGVGFDVSALDDDRFGLRGMRERAELIGAHLRIDSAPAQGTTVTVTLRPRANPVTKTDQTDTLSESAGD